MNEEKEKIEKIMRAIGERPLAIKLKKLDDRAVVPTYAHDGDVGMDITAIDVEYDEKNDLYIYHTGLALETDLHYGVLLFCRSSNRKTDAYLPNHVGIVDSALYRGEMQYSFKNRVPIAQRALNEATEAYFNALMDGHDVEEALAAMMNRRTEVLSDPMRYAPYQVGDRIGQMVAIPYPQVKMEVVDKLTETERGANGFGSTGR